MRVVRMLDNCQIKRGESTVEDLKGGEFYIMSDVFMQMLQTLAPHVLGLEIPFSEVYNGYSGQNLNNKKLIAIRHGGGGDILFMSTAMKVIKKKFPDSKISVGIGAQYKPLIEFEPEIEKVYNLPISLSDWNDFHHHLFFEGIIEDNSEAEQYNAYDLFIRATGFDPRQIPVEEKIPRFKCLPSYTKECKNKFKELLDPNVGRIRVGIQTTTSTSIRNYPPGNWPSVAEGLIKRGCDIFFLGSSAQAHIIQSIVGAIGKHAFDASFHNLKDSIGLATFMDYIIAPDSMFIHIGAALNKPVIGIYGPFHSSLRMKYFKNCIGIDAEVGCSPCFMHGHFPCWKGDPSPCFSVIKPAMILQTFDMLREEIHGN